MPSGSGPSRESVSQGFCEGISDVTPRRQSSRPTRAWRRTKRRTEHRARPFGWSHRRATLRTSLLIDNARESTSAHPVQKHLLPCRMLCRRSELWRTTDVGPYGRRTLKPAPVGIARVPLLKREPEVCSTHFSLELTVNKRIHQKTGRTLLDHSGTTKFLTVEEHPYHDLLPHRVLKCDVRQSFLQFLRLVSPDRQFDPPQKLVDQGPCVGT